MLSNVKNKVGLLLYQSRNIFEKWKKKVFSHFLKMYCERYNQSEVLQ